MLNKNHHATDTNALAAKFRNCSNIQTPTAGLQRVELTFEIWPRGEIFSHLFIRSIPAATLKVRESATYLGDSVLLWRLAGCRE
jgi:hypothetical protein